MKVHGNFSVEIAGNYIYIKFIGACNKEMAENFYLDFMSKTKGIKIEKLKVLIDCTEFHGATPDSFKYTKMVNQWQNDNNLVGKAIVSSQQILVQLVKYSDSEFAKQNVKIFEDYTDAIKWLESL